MNFDELAKYKHTLGYLTESVDLLENDYKFLTAGNVFMDDLVDMWIKWKREEELDPMAFRPRSV